MQTIINFAIGWYLIGLAVILLACYLDWCDGDDLKLGELLGSFFLALFGPILLIPMCEFLGLTAAIKKSWKNRMNSPVLAGRKRNDKRTEA